MVMKMWDFNLWSLAYDNGYRCGVMIANQLEVLNKALKGSRSLLVTVPIELIFTRINTYFINFRARYENKLSYGKQFSYKSKRVVGSH